MSQDKKPLRFSRLAHQAFQGYWQAGILYELPVVALILIVVGIASSGRHPAFLVFAVLGVVVFLLPTIAGAIGRISGRAANGRLVARSAEELRQREFSPQLVFCGNLSSEALFVDPAGGRVAAVDAAGNMEIFGISELDGILLRSEKFTRLGGSPSWVRYSLIFSRGENRHSLLFSSRRRARRLFCKAQGVLGDAVPFRDETTSRNKSGRRL